MSREDAGDVIGFPCLVTSCGMASFPGALPLVSESIALLTSFSVGSVYSFVIPGRLSMVYSASCVIVLSVEDSSTYCSTHLSICLAMTSPDCVFRGQFIYGWTCCLLNFIVHDPGISCVRRCLEALAEL